MKILIESENEFFRSCKYSPSGRRSYWKLPSALKGLKTGEHSMIRKFLIIPLILSHHAKLNEFARTSNPLTFIFDFRLKSFFWLQAFRVHSNHVQINEKSLQKHYCSKCQCSVDWGVKLIKIFKINLQI